MSARAPEPRAARIGPCRDPLRLWFLEWRDETGQAWRRYYANRDEARAALRTLKRERERRAP